MNFDTVHLFKVSAFFFAHAASLCGPFLCCIGIYIHLTTYLHRMALWLYVQNITDLKEGWHTKVNKTEFKLTCASLAAHESSKSRYATVQETRKVCRRLLRSLFIVVVRDLLANLSRRRCYFISFVHLKEIKKKSKSYHHCDLKCRS